ncbi:ACP S-malonyltransferase [Pseudoflavonifractor sp. MSJ-37]|uniref:ACP S-malonyltransferase n=1 Tax=Pseudoflavonifractor sp. MSJ-37 TaxID=2841531 RepID=UPI001C128879|nr:ACP S-malonyltransferase [Pseudoflavonifractor sp. MSJ-37]MBU5436176.1 ACP S-malonyltransferase [Pseudoflavonifractor sp. MSJ-37]
MKLAFLYAGQGAQHVGMGRDFYDRFPLFRDIFDRAPVEFDLKGLCFDGPEEALSDTRYTQPCMVAFAAGVTGLLYQAGIRPSMAAGLSLGEYSALMAAGALSPEDAIALVAFRGKAMAEAVTGRPCGMAAVLSLDREKLQTACDAAADLGVAEIANYNCPGQLVIAGDAAAVDKAGALAKEAGARRVVPLKVSGPFHTSLMAPAGDALREKFRTVEFRPMAFPVLFNCKGDVMGPGDTIPALLERQVQSSVYLEDTIRRMAAHGVDTIVEIGPGKTLSGFVRKTVKGIDTYAIDTAEDLDKVIAALKGEGA